MPDSYKEYLLNILLDKYEKSKHWKEEARVQRKVSFRFEQEQFPSYYLEGLSSEMDLINANAVELEKNKTIKIKWVRGEVGNLIDAIYLNLLEVELAYQLANRVPLREDMKDMIVKLLDVTSMFSIVWIKNFLDSCLEQLHNKRWPTHLGKDEDDVGLLLNALAGIQQINGEVSLPERLFSVKYLGNSKIFEKQVRTRVINIFKKYGAENFQANEGFSLHEMEDQEVLQEIGILKSIEELLIRGSLKLELKGNLLDYAPFVYGNMLDSSSIRMGVIREIGDRNVLIIENKAVYKEVVSYIEEGKELLVVGDDNSQDNNWLQHTLVVYLGGFPGPDKRLFFEKVRQFEMATPKVNINYYFWGDLDYGGIQIYRHLKSLVLPELQPFQMGVKTWNYYKIYGETIDSTYKKKLIRLLELKDIPEFDEVLKTMIADELRLEQECMVVG